MQGHVPYKVNVKYVQATLAIYNILNKEGAINNIYVKTSQI